MKRLLSCEFNMDTACVELKFANGSMIAIDTIAVENEVADNIYQRSELDWLIYNDPAAYADLVLNGDPQSLSCHVRIQPRSSGRFPGGFDIGINCRRIRHAIGLRELTLVPHDIHLLEFSQIQ